MIQPGVQRDRSHPWARIQDDSLRQSTYSNGQHAKLLAVEEQKSRSQKLVVGSLVVIGLEVN